MFILLVFLCVTLHEFGHIAMARRFGVNTPEVILSPIGGIAAMERMPDKPRQDLLVAIAGPLVNVVIALVLMAALGLGPVLLTTAGFDQGSLAERLLLVNIMLVAFNLIPAFPMDGGRVLRALLAMKLGAPRATAIAARIGQAFAVAFFVLGLLWSPILMVVGVFIYFAASAEEQQAAFTGFAARLTAQLCLLGRRNVERRGSPGDPHAGGGAERPPAARVLRVPRKVRAAAAGGRPERGGDGVHRPLRAKVPGHVPRGVKGAGGGAEGGRGRRRGGGAKEVRPRG